MKYAQKYGHIRGFCDECGKAVDDNTPVCRPCRGLPEKEERHFEEDEPAERVRPQKRLLKKKYKREEE